MAKPDWITLSKSSGSGNDAVIVTAEKNTSTAPRSGAITVRAGSISKVVTVSQEGAAAAKGKIIFLYTGEEIPQKYVGYSLFIGESNANFIEIFADYGRIESIADDSVSVNFDNMSQENLETTLATINGDLTDMDEVYFGVSSSDDPSIDWIPLLLVNDPGDEEFTNQNMAAKIQSVFNGTSEIIHGKSLFTPSEVVCSWGIPTAKFLLAGTTQDVLDSASVSHVDFTVFADLYPDGQRLNNDSMINIRIGQFTLGESSDGKWLSRLVNVSKASATQSFTWRKEWSTVALCRFTISCTAFNDVDVSLTDNLVINGKTFMQHKNGGDIYFENTEGIPLQKTSDSQNVNVSSNQPILDFTAIN